MHDDAGISRRSALKRIAVGTAVAWTAPILTTVRSPAFAAASSVCAQADSKCNHCGNGTHCGHISGTVGVCVCSQTVEGGCFCGEVIPCHYTHACKTSADCQDQPFSVWHCVPTCGCNGLKKACIPECGTFDFSPGKKATLKTAKGPNTAGL